MRAWTEDFEGWSVRVERWIDAGDDRVVALTHQSGTGKGSGVPVELNLGVVSELKDGTTPSRSSRAVAMRHARRARTVRS
jgi:hypothetical protein